MSSIGPSEMTPYEFVALLEMLPNLISDKDISNWASFGGPPKTALYNTLYESRCQVFTYNCVSSTEANQTLNLPVDKYVQYSIHR